MLLLASFHRSLYSGSATEASHSVETTNGCILLHVSTETNRQSHIFHSLTSAAVINVHKGRPNR